MGTIRLDKFVGFPTNGDHIFIDQQTSARFERNIKELSSAVTKIDPNKLLPSPLFQFQFFHTTVTYQSLSRR